jgi:S-adenosyl methyltransferase
MKAEDQAGDQAECLPAGTSGPSVARVHDCLPGGKDNLAADREQAARLLDVAPDLGRLARENRWFIARAVTWLAAQVIGQFIDLGCGFPAIPGGDWAVCVRSSTQTKKPASRTCWSSTMSSFARHSDDSGPRDVT